MGFHSSGLFSLASAWTSLNCLVGLCVLLHVNQAARFFDELRILARFVQPQLEDVQAEAKKIFVLRC